MSIMCSRSSMKQIKALFLGVGNGWQRWLHHSQLVSEPGPALDCLAPQFPFLAAKTIRVLLT